MKSVFVCFLALIFSVNAVFAAPTLDDLELLIQKVEKNPNNFALVEELGIMYHDLSEEHIVDGAKDAVKYLEMAYEINPNPVTKCFLGSAWTMVARDTDNPIIKLDAVSRGVKMIDGASEEVSEAPGIYIVPFIRMQNSYSLPEDFARMEFVNNDIAFLLKTYKQTPAVFDDLYDPAEIFLYKGLYLLRDNKTRLAYQFWKVGLTFVKSESVRFELEKNMERIEG